MHAYAQTSVQLFNQLRSEGYSDNDRERVREAYEFAMRLFTGLFLPSGKSFIAHLVGTASILASLHSSIEVVTAGLLHAAYLHGDFGGITKGISNAKRKQVRDAVGKVSEEYVAKYDQLVWTAPKIRTAHDNLADLDSVDREVLLMRLANELEHQLDLGGLYFAESENAQQGHQRYMKSYSPMLMGIAERLGFSSLAAEMEVTFANLLSAHLPVVPWIRSKHHVAYLVVPQSYRERFSVRAWRKLSHAFRFAIVILRRAKRLWGRAFKLIQNVAQRPSRPA